MVVFLGAVPLHYAFFGEVTGPNQLSNVNCVGDETNLYNCTHKNYYCNPSLAASVKCTSMCIFLHVLYK